MTELFPRSLPCCRVGFSSPYSSPPQHQRAQRCSFLSGWAEGASPAGPWAPGGPGRAVERLAGPVD